MSTEQLLNNASIVMTVVSLITFIGILVWVYGLKSRRDYDIDANIVFDEQDNDAQNNLRNHHV